jgi:hypothetical protein
VRKCKKNPPKNQFFWLYGFLNKICTTTFVFNLIYKLSNVMHVWYLTLYFRKREGGWARKKKKRERQRTKRKKEGEKGKKEKKEEERQNRNKNRHTLFTLFAFIFFPLL